MAVTEQSPTSSFTANGVTTVFAFAFLLLQESDLVVQVTDTSGVVTTKTLGVDYTIAGVGVATGGTVTFTAAPASDYKVVIFRDSAIERATDYQNNGDLLAETVNKDFDRLWLVLQEIFNGGKGAPTSLRVPNGETIAALPVAADRANKVQAFDSDGNPILIVGVDASSAAALQIDLASSASAAKGAGQIGFAYALSYGAGTIGKWLKDLALSTGAGFIGFNPSLSYTASTLGWVEQHAGITPSMCQHAGTVDPTGVADSTAALQYWASCPWPKLGDPGAIYKVSAPLTFAANTLDIDGRGMTIIGAAGSYPSYGVIYVEGSLSALPDLSASVAKGVRTLPFVSAHGLTAGMVGLIYNPTDYSWNSSYTYSRAGEFFRVAYVSSPTDVKTDNVLWDSYTAANVDLYVMAENRVNIRNLTVTAPGSGGVRPIRIRLATRVRLENVDCSGADLVQLDFDRCHDVYASGMNIDNRRQVAAATYGVSIGNSQDVTITGGQINATRHAVAIGGDDVVGAVVCRNITINGGSTLRNDSALSSVPCADIHANAESITYEDCTIFGGGSWSGKDVAYKNVRFKECATGVGAMIQGGSMWVGGYAIAEGCTFEATGAYANGLSRLFVDATNTRFESHLIMRDNVVSLGACDTFARVDNSHATIKANAVVDGVDFTDSASLSNVLRMSGTGTGNYARVMGVSNGKTGASMFVEAGGYVVTNVRLMEQAGVAVITSNPAANTASTSVTFPLSYGSRTPAMSLVLDAADINSKTIVPRVGSVSAAGFGAYHITADHTVLGGVATAVNAHWTARV